MLGGTHYWLYDRSLLAAFSPSGRTLACVYSQWECFFCSCLLLELEAWVHPEDPSPRSRCGCAVEDPRALEPTGPLMGKHKNFAQKPELYKDSMMCREAKQLKKTSITSGIVLSGVRAPCRNTTWTSLSSYGWPADRELEASGWVFFWDQRTEPKATDTEPNRPAFLKKPVMAHLLK